MVLVDPATNGNVGAIIRSALAFDIHDIAVIREEPYDIFSPQILRSSMGARFKTHLEAFGTMEDYIARFPENKRYAFMLDDETSVSYDTVTGETEVWSEYGDSEIDADELDERLEAGRSLPSL